MFERLPVWVFASLLSNLLLVSIEFVNRTSGGLQEALTKTLPLIIAAQVCLFYSFNGAPSLLMAWIVLTIGNSLVRLGVAATVLGEPLQLGWAMTGAATMFFASYCIKQATA